HRTQYHAVQFTVGLLDGGYHGDIGHVGYHGTRAHCRFYSRLNPLVIHYGSDIARTQIPGDALPDNVFRTTDVDVGRFRYLHDFRTEVGELYFTDTVQRVLFVGVFLEKDIRVTTFLLRLGNFDQ